MQGTLKRLVLEQFWWVRTLYKLNDHHLVLHNSDGNCSAIHDGQDTVKCMEFDTIANNTARESKDTKRKRDGSLVVNRALTMDAWNTNLRYPQLYEHFCRRFTMPKGLSRLLPICQALVIHTTFDSQSSEE